MLYISNFLLQSCLKSATVSKGLVIFMPRQFHYRMRVARGLFLCLLPARERPIGHFSQIHNLFIYICIHTRALNCCNRGQPPHTLYFKMPKCLRHINLLYILIFLFTNCCLLCECKKYIVNVCGSYLPLIRAAYKNWFERKIKGRTWLCARSFTPCMRVELVRIVPSGRATQPG